MKALLGFGLALTLATAAAVTVIVRYGALQGRLAAALADLEGAAWYD